MALHARSIAFGFVDLDDRDLVVEDRAFLAHPGHLVRALARPYMHVVDPAHPYLRPLVTASYALDAQWSGVRPFGYHLTNVVLHAVASALCLGLLRRLGFAPLVAILGALVFAVHPALVSAVAWIPGRNDSLLAIWALGAWIAFASYAEQPSLETGAIHLALFALALFTKETAVMLPAVCGAHLLLIDRRTVDRSARRLLALAPGWAACAALRFVARPWAAGGAAAASAEIARHLRLLSSGLGQLVLPYNPSLVGAASDSPVAGGLLAAAGLVVLTAAVRGARPRVILYGAAAFVLWSLPSLAVPGSLVLSSRLYLPAVGAIIAGAESARALGLEARVLGAFGAAAVAILAVVAAGYESTFRDPRSFARAAVDAAPRCAVAHFCMGSVDQRAGDDDGALAQYAIAIELGTTYVVHNNVAVIHMARGQWVDAERELHEELTIDPRYALAYRNLAIVLRHEGRADDATAAEACAAELSGEPSGAAPISACSADPALRSPRR